MGRLAPPPPRRFKQSLAPRPRLACAGELLLHLAQCLLTALELGFGDRQIVGSLAPLTLGGGDGIEQAPAPLLDLGREVGKRGKVGTRFGLARAQDLDLLARLEDAILPKLPLSRDRLKPLLPQANLSFEAFQRRLCPSRLRTARSGLRLRGPSEASRAESGARPSKAVLIRSPCWRASPSAARVRAIASARAPSCLLLDWAARSAAAIASRVRSSSPCASFALWRSVLVFCPALSALPVASASSASAALAWASALALSSLRASSRLRSTSRAPAALAAPDLML